MRVIKQPNAGLWNSTPRSRRVLAIVGDTQVGLWVVRSLGRFGLKVLSVCASTNGLAAHSRYSHGVCVPEASGGWQEWVDQIEQLAGDFDVGSIMTIAEGYHAALIRSRQRFEPDVLVFSPPADCYEKATDKDYMHGLCVRLGIPVARGTTLADFVGGPDAPRLEFPLVLRTRRQSSQNGTQSAPWKAAYAENQQHLEALYDQVRDIADNVLVQECHPGVEDHVQILMQDGEPFMVGDYIGEHHMPLAGGVTVQRISCHHEKLINDAVRLLQAIEWEGIAGAQFHYDPRTDEYIFLEINPRFIGGLPTVIMAGFEAPFLLWQSHFEPEKMRRGRYQLGMRTRILGGDANWLLGMIRGDQLPPGQRRLSKLSAIGRFLWNCGPWTSDDTFNLGDIKPTLIDWKQMIRRLGAESFDIIGAPKTQDG